MGAGARAIPAAALASGLAAAAVLTGLLIGALIAYGLPIGLGLLGALAYGLLVLTRFSLGLAVWVFLVFFEGLAVVEWGVRGAGLLLVFAWLGTLSQRRAAVTGLLQRHGRLLATVVLLLLWLSVSAAWAAKPDLGVRFWQWHVVVAVFLVIATSVGTKRSLELVVGAFLLGVLMAALLGLAGTLGLDSSLAASSLQAPATPAAGDPGRLAGGMADPNVMATAVVAAIVLAGGLAVRVGRSIARVVLLATIPVLVFALIATESRTGLVVGAVAIIVGFVVFRERRAPLSIFVVLAVSLTAVALFSVGPPEFIDRIQNVSEDRGTGRLDLWLVAWEMSKDHPLVGVGINNFPEFSGRYVNEIGSVERADFIAESRLVPHNAYIELLAETGVIGLSLFLLVVGGCLRAALHAIRGFAAVGDADGLVLAQTVLTATLVLLAGSFFSHSGALEHLWVMLALGPAMLGVAKGQPTTTIMPPGPSQRAPARGDRKRGVPQGRAVRPTSLSRFHARSL